MEASLIDQIIQASGLPEEYAKRRLHFLLLENNIDPKRATLDDIRVVLATLLQDLILSGEFKAPS